MLSVAITDKILLSRSFNMHLILTIAKYAILTAARLLANCSEVILFLMTLGGPWLLLVLVLVTNFYLIVKPVAHSLLPNVTYKRAFAQARREICTAFRLHAKLYHRHEIEGFEKIPSSGGAVIVYYHGAIPLDYAFLYSEVLLKKNRVIFSVIDKYMIWIPGFEMMSAGLGCFAGTRKDCVRKLRSGSLLGVAPGGGLEAQCARSDSYEILWKKRSGFASVAQEAGVPIIPVFTENIRESVCNMQSGQSIWRKVYQITKIPVTPLYGGFPVKLTTHIGDPIYPDDKLSVEDLRVATVQAMESLIQKHQKLPGDVVRAVCERIETESDYLAKKYIDRDQSISDFNQYYRQNSSRAFSSVSDNLSLNEDCQNDAFVDEDDDTEDHPIHMAIDEQVFNKKESDDDDDDSDVSSGLGSLSSTDLESSSSFI